MQHIFLCAVRNVGCHPALVVCTFCDRTNLGGQVCSGDTPMQVRRMLPQPCLPPVLQLVMIPQRGKFIRVRAADVGIGVAPLNASRYLKDVS